MVADANGQLSIGVDVGGTHLRAVLLAGENHVVASQHRKLVAVDPQGLLAAIQDAVLALGERPGNLPMGVGLAGLLDGTTGVVANSPNLHWRNVPFGALLAERFGQPVRLVNDLNAITVGEAKCGAGEGSLHVVCVFVGTGVGMGAVSHGLLIEGYKGVATELGHIKSYYGELARLCGCGSYGCLEAHTSGRHLPALLQQRLSLGDKSPWREKAPQDPVAADSIEKAFLAHDPACVALWHEVSGVLGHAIANTIALFNPEVLILGGGVLASAPSLKKQLVEKIRLWTHDIAGKDLRIVDTKLGEKAGAIGAAVLAQQTHLPTP